MNSLSRISDNLTEMTIFKFDELDPLPGTSHRHMHPEECMHIAMKRYHGEIGHRHYGRESPYAFQSHVQDWVSRMMKVFIEYNNELMDEEEAKRIKEKFARMIKMQDAIDFISDKDTKVIHRGEYYAVIRKFDIIMEIDTGEIFISDYQEWVEECASSLKLFKENELKNQVKELTAYILDGEKAPKEFEVNLNSRVQAL